MPPGYESVTLVTKDGQKIRGVKKNEDVFSIQIMDTRERIQRLSEIGSAAGHFRKDVADARLWARAG